MVREPLHLVSNHILIILVIFRNKMLLDKSHGVGLGWGARVPPPPIYKKNNLKSFQKENPRCLTQRGSEGTYAVKLARDTHVQFKA